MPIARARPPSYFRFPNNKRANKEPERRFCILRSRLRARKAAQTLSSREQQLEKLSAAVVRSVRKDDLVRQLKALERAAKELMQIDAQLAVLISDQRR